MRKFIEDPAAGLKVFVFAMVGILIMLVLAFTYVELTRESSSCELRGGELVRPAVGFGFVCAVVLP